MNGHTPGPWKVETVLDEVEQITNLVIAIPGPPTHCDKHVAQLSTWGGSPDPEVHANARLIAAAPEMAEALRIMVDAFNVEDIDPLIAFASIEKARAALARARGES